MLYFAYGSNMDLVQMASRCPGATPVGKARLPGHRLAFVTDASGYDGGVATIVPDSSQDLWGVLWEIGESHLAALDQWEGYGYTRGPIEVLAPEPTQAVVYIATLNQAEAPKSRYLDGILRGAADNGLPEEYIERLRRWANKDQ